MTDAGLAILYALFVWWFSTGLVFLVVLRRQAAVRAGLIGAAILFPLCLIVLAASAGMTSVAGAIIAFTAAIVLWGTQEVAFLTGFLTGPRPLPCPPGATGLDRLGAALGAILYHELALLATSGAVVAVTWQSANPFGALTFLVLWIMRVSAKLNLFLGVPVLNDEAMPQKIAYLRTYFRRGPVNPAVSDLRAHRGADDRRLRRSRRRSAGEPRLGLRLLPARRTHRAGARRARVHAGPAADRAIVEVEHGRRDAERARSAVSPCGRSCSKGG